MDCKIIVESLNLRNPDSIDVVCGNHKKRFFPNEYSKIKEWVCEVWSQTFSNNILGISYPEAKLYFNIDWDCDNVYYGKIVKEQMKMTFKCVECGCIFEEGEEKRWEETHGLSYEPFEKVSGCPACCGAYEEAHRCGVCGEFFLGSEMVGDVCNGCLDTYRKDFKKCYEIAKNDRQNVKISAIFISLLGEELIEEILEMYVENEMPNIDCSSYIDDDKYWFSDKIIEEVEK